MKPIDIDFTIWLRVHDTEALFRAAIKHRTSVEAEASFYPADPVAQWGEDYRNEDGTVDIHACLVELLDPGVPPPGCEILDSGAVPACTGGGAPSKFQAQGLPTLQIGTAPVTSQVVVTHKVFEGVVQLDRSTFPEAEPGDRVVVEGVYGTMEIPKTVGTVLDADEHSVTISIKEKRS